MTTLNESARSVLLSKYEKLDEKVSPKDILQYIRKLHQDNSFLITDIQDFEKKYDAEILSAKEIKMIQNYQKLLTDLKYSVHAFK